MKAFRNIIFTISRVIITTLFCIIGAVIIHVIIKGRSLTPESIYNAIVTGFVLGISVWLIYYSIRIVVRISRKNRLEKYLIRKGYCDEFYNKIKEKLNKKSENKALKHKLFLAKQLCDGERFDEAVELMNELDARTVDASQTGKYYSCYFYVLVCAQKLDDAEKILEISGEYIYQTQLGLLALGIYNYAREEYQKSEDILLDIKLTSPTHIKITAKMFLALCYLKCEKNNEAKRIVCELIPKVTNPVLKSNLNKLMKLVEIAYGINCEEKSEEEEDISQDAGSID